MSFKKIKMKNKETSCNFCGKKESDLLFVNYDHSIKSNQTFNVVRCKKCGLVRINSLPIRIEDCYSDDYEPYNPKKSDFYFSLNRILMMSYCKGTKTLADLLKSAFCKVLYSPSIFSGKGKILDIGCGNGGYLSILRDCGWEVYGFDFSEKAVKYAKNERGLVNVKQSKVENIDYPENFFDLVTMNHLIEHLPNPKNSLIEAKRVLRKGGILIVTTPNFSSLNAKIFGKNWFPLETPRHLFLFEVSTLKRMINDISGLEITKVKYDYSAYCLAKSLGYFLGNRPLINHLLMTIKIIFWPYTILLSLFGRSDIMTFILKKNETP